MARRSSAERINFTNLRAPLYRLGVGPACDDRTKTIAKWTRVAFERSTDPMSYQRTRTPVAVMFKHFAASREGAPHRHRRAQLVYATAGTMRVETPDGTRIVPPSHALWVPSGVRHAVSTLGEVRMRTLYVEPGLARRKRLPETCSTIAVTPLLRELIASAAELPLDEPLDARGRHLVGLLLDELRTVDVVPLQLPMPSDPELAAICRAVLADPVGADAERLARRMNVGSKTFARRFKAQTGMTFGAWRRQASLLEALAHLAAGKPVTTVALDLGYESPSAFTAMFRRATGTPPSRYFDAAANA